jgi:hypothetical protein
VRFTGAQHGGWAVAAVITAAAALVMVGSPAGAQDGPVAAEDTRSTPVMPRATVSDHVTRVIFEQPRTLDELADELAGTEVLQLRYTGDVTGASQPGPGVPAAAAIAELRADTVREYQAPPLVFMVIVDGTWPASTVRSKAEVRVFDSAAPDVDRLPTGLMAEAARATRARQAALGLPAPNPHLVPVPRAGAGEPRVKEHAWSPLQGQMQSWDTELPPESDYPRKFRHNLTWWSQEDLDAFGDDFGYEHNMSLFNEADISDWTRPYCHPFDWNEPYENFWAAWDVWAFKWNAVKWGGNVPGEAVPYWDWDDTTDSCQKLDFTIGIGYPRNLAPQVGYSVWIHAMRGDQSSSPYALGAQKLSDDCDNLGMDPGSSCMGLNANRPGSGTEILVNKSRGWTVSGCANWNPNIEPQRLANGEAGCPPNG